MNRTLPSLALIACTAALAGCGSEAPIAQTAEAAAPVVQTQPGVGHIYGRWALDPAFCSADGASRVITIGEQKLDSRNYACTMTTPEVNGEGWLVTLECTGSNGAEDVTERVRFVPNEEKLELNYIDRTERNDERLVRCP
jgi:predicted small lipoprotein YifL